MHVADELIHLVLSCRIGSSRRSRYQKSGGEGELRDETKVLRWPAAESNESNRIIDVSTFDMTCYVGPLTDNTQRLNLALAILTGHRKKLDFDGKSNDIIFATYKL